MKPVRHVARAGEHDVLEEVGEAGPTNHFILRADLVPDVYGNRRRRLVGREDDGKAVRQRVGFEGKPQSVGCGRGPLLRLGDYGCLRRQGRGNDCRCRHGRVKYRSHVVPPDIRVLPDVKTCDDPIRFFGREWWGQTGVRRGSDRGQTGVRRLSGTRKKQSCALLSK